MGFCRLIEGGMYKMKSHDLIILSLLLMDDEFAVLNMCFPFEHEPSSNALESVEVFNGGFQLFGCESHFARGMSRPFTKGRRFLQ